MKFFNSYKREFSTLLLLAFLHGFVVEAFAVTTKPISRMIFPAVRTYDSSAELLEQDLLTAAVAQQDLESEQGATAKAHPHQRATNASSQLEASTVFYGADLALGEIGRSERTTFDSPEDNLFKIEIKEDIDLKATYSLTYEVYGIANASGVTKSVNTATSTGGFFIEKKTTWTRVSEFLSPFDLKRGTNTVLFTSDLTKDFGYLVRNVQFEKTKAATNDFLLINEAVKATATNEVYINGVVTITDPAVRLFLDNKEVAVKNHTFESLVALDATSKKELVFELRKDNQPLEKKSVALSQIKAIDQTKALDVPFDKAMYKMVASEAKLYELDHIAIELPEASYPSDFTLSIQELRASDYAPTGMALKNVTKNMAAYRFLPDGIKFEKDVKVKIKCDINALPKGYGLKDVQVFYFDTTVKQWTKVKVIEVLEETGEVVALTNHFTDYLAGVIQEPESPETNAFAPTTISGIQAANPTENIPMVSVPQINDRGDASLSFPLLIPQGRQGMTPDLSINYSSGSDEGDFGLGWSLSVKSIDIDTRWGVPIFDSTKETESYLLNGEELLLVKSDNTLYAPHKDALIPRGANVKFNKLVHDPSIEIMRIGNNVSNYTWTVRDNKSGWVYTYGISSGGKWYLTLIKDPFNNSIEYEYDQTSLKGNYQLKKIAYNHNRNYFQNGTAGDRHVFYIEIFRKQQLDNPSIQRKDRKINNRLGFESESVHLIDKIVVKTGTRATVYSEPGTSGILSTESAMHNEYSFVYKEGQFGRSLLEKIVNKNYNNHTADDFYSQRDRTILPVIQQYVFDYHDDIGTGSLFESNGQTYKTYKDYKTDYDNFKVFLSALGGGEGKSTSFGGGGSAGAVLPFFLASWLPFSRAATIGANFTWGSSNSQTKTLLTDIDGDGLPDKVFKGGNNFFYRKNLGNKFSSETYPIKNLPNLNYSSSNSTDESFSINIMVGSASKSNSESVSSTYSYTTDVNGDGLLDVVDNERVYFGYIDPVTKEPTFNFDSSLTPAIVIKEEDMAPILNPMPQLNLTNGLMDVVMVWRAPKDGTIKIDGTITKEHIALQSGVKFSIEKLHETNMEKAAFIYGPYLMLSSSKTHTQTLNVVKGDLIFFRTHSNQVPVKELGVTWNPKVTYLTQNFESATGEPKYSSDFQESMIVGTNYEHTFMKAGRYRLEWPSFNFNTGDDVTIKVSHYIKGANGGAIVAATGNNVVVYEKKTTINGITTFSSPNLTLNMTSINNNSATFQYVKVEVLSDTEVNWKDIDAKFKPKLVSLDGQEHVFAVPYYSNYSNVHTSYAYSDFTNYFTGTKLSINHDFSLPNCTKNICEDRYIYLILKRTDGKLAPLNTGTTLQYAKFRYKINASGAVVARQRFDVTANNYVAVANTTTYFLENLAGGKVFFEYYTADKAIAERLKTYQNTGSNYLVRLNNLAPKTDYIEGGDNGGLFKANIYSSELTTAWGNMYRNWGQFAYKGVDAAEKFTSIIGDHIHVYNPNKTNSAGQNSTDIFENPNLTLEEVEASFDQILSLSGNVTNQFAVLMPNKQLNRWESHEHLYVSATGVVSPYTRFLTDEIPELKPPTVPVHDFGAAGVTKYSKFDNSSTNLSLGFLGINVGKTKTKGSSSLLNDFIDINGDGFPDIIGTKIQLTAKRGGLSSKILNEDLNSRTSIEGSGKLAGGSNSGIKGSAAIGSTSGNLNLVVGNQGSASVSGSSFTTTNKVDRFYVDINGDGLIDIVQNNGKVLLNYGGTFLASTAWSSTLPFQESQTLTIGAGAGGGFSGISNMDIAAGLSISGSTSKDKITYMDVNGDGLPEKIINETTYYINLGTGFETIERTLPGAQAQKSTEVGINANVTICFYFPTIWLVGPKFCGAVVGSKGKSISSEEARYMDFDGDGFTDYVTSDNDESLTVYGSRIKRTNLLKTVIQSTGSKIELDYDIVNPIDKSVIGSTYKMPYKKWALTKVSVSDGFVGDGQNISRYAYEYFNGYKDRKERSFLGFGMTKAHILDRTGVVYRTTVTEYLNNDMTEDQLYRPGTSSDLKQFLYKKGLPKRSYTLDRTKRMLNETAYTYKFYDTAKLLTDINTTTANNAAEVKVYSEKLSVLPLVTTIKNKVVNFDEDAQNSSFTQNTEQQFIIYDKFGNVKKFSDVNRGLTVDIEYQIGVKTLSTSHRVSTTSGNQMLRLTKAFSNDGLKIHRVQKYSTPTIFYDTNYEYDRLGNLTRKIFTNGFFYFYDYGDLTGFHGNYFKIVPAKIRDGFGNETKMLVNPFGQPIKTTDVYGEVVTYKYDRFNRLMEMKGPYESEWTIRNEYISNRIAISQHNLGQGNILHTSMINDGLGRTVQVKKEILATDASPRCGGQIPKVRLAVSGDMIYDEFGRVVENYLAEEQLDCNSGAQLRNLLTTYYQGPRLDEKKVARLYDNKDRVVEELIFGTDAKTKTKYSFGTDNKGKTVFTQEVTLPEGNKSISYTDELGLQTGQKQIGSEDLWTSFTYDLLGLPKTVTNAMGHETAYNYDNLGRVTNKTLAASGITKYKYDFLSNVIEKEDANGTIITYNYQFNRLLGVVNPTIQTTFTYEPGGRLKKMEDSSGYQEFRYGKLGEVIEDNKMLIDINGDSQFFKTKYKYDSWGRILEMIYPDGEKVLYQYNRVGQLTGIRGEENIIFLRNVKYTHFDQPYYMKYGNNVVTHQEFDLTERLRASQLSSSDLLNPLISKVFSRNVYGFDKNNNITGQVNDFSQHQSIVVGGTSRKMYTYDEFNRLKSAKGQWDGLLEAHNYDLEMKYTKDHSISVKDQNHLIRDKNSGGVEHSQNSLVRNYKYNDSSKPRVGSIIGVDRNGQQLEQQLDYFENGNIKSIHNEFQTDSFVDRLFEWDANNNITKIEDNGRDGHVLNQYIYDGKGERVIKRLQGGNSLSVNGSNPQNGMYGAHEVLYPGGHLVYNRSVYTKHYYANGKRIASKIMDVTDLKDFKNRNLNSVRTSPHEGMQQRGIAQNGEGQSSIDRLDNGLIAPLPPDVAIVPPISWVVTICKDQVNILLDVLYNTAETIDCKNDILNILELHKLYLYRCVNNPDGTIGTCDKIFYDFDYCKALEEINKLVCIKRTPNGDIIDPGTGYIYDPVTGIPKDPITGLPIDNGTGNDYDRLELDCYNKFINFIDYYKDKPNKPAEYYLFLKYLRCFNDNTDECFGIGIEGTPGGPGQTPVVEWDKDRKIRIRFCDLIIPDLPVDPGLPPVDDPVFPDETLSPGINGGTWTNNPPPRIPIIADPMKQESPVWWYHSDHLGSSSYITDISGKPCQYIEYLPFGEVMVQQSTNNIFENVYKFNGKELDESTGYYYYGARYYDPGASIFLSVDPLVEQTMEPYSYVGNNPINFTDPTGMSKECEGCKGFVLSVVDNIFGSNLRNTYATDSQKYRNGVSTGNAASLLASAVLLVDGVSSIGTGGVGLVASGAATATGVGAVVGVPGAVLSGASIAKGTVEIAVGTIIGVNAMKNMESDNASSHGGGRGSNNRTADPNAVGDHTVINENGHTTYKVNNKNPNKNNNGLGFETEKRVDYKGAAHINKKTKETVNTPHVQENGSVRPARPGIDMPNK
ncbi:RHS repeat-associated core domain-containing protein [Flavobacterium sp. HSC-61S13]|uniref:RHS repeat-associated core domain-containing protein n=1 Tax=Flavobacterium sp. HSC-61S13 TaxID=2910963 RepID=UPI0020A0469C|nr:RHS repeat-associated core domain-containing protein [Flavobacterium sp. HSC-61S13]MCP1995124.1 RHS repeat-associated protein [Flavobacterium sp. HSC-61S13]